MDDLTALRGELRDGVAAVQTLSELVRSPRVSRRAVASARIEAAEGCALLAAGAHRLERALGIEAGLDPETLAAAGSVIARCRLRATELERRLRGTEPAGDPGLGGGDPRTPGVRRASRPLDRFDTRARLRLETESAVAAGELATALALVDLFAARPRRAPASSVDLADVLGAHAEAPVEARAPARVVLAELGPDATFEGDGRHALAIIELAAALVAAPPEARLGLRATKTAELRVEVFLAPRDAVAHRRVWIAARGPIPELARALPFAARRAGFDVALEEGGRVAIRL